MNRKTILLVQNDPALVDALVHHLNAAGFEVLVANDGAQAVSTASQQVPDLIILADVYPSPSFGGVAWNGFMVRDWVRRMTEAGHVPVLLISEDGSPALRERALAAGMLDVFAKPVDLESLVAAAQHILAGAAPSSSIDAECNAPA